MIKLEGHNLSIKDVVFIARNMENVALSDKAVEAMLKSRAFVEDIIEKETSIYGINTGFGPLSRTRISKDELREHQLNLLHHLSVGQGDLFTEDETRAIMVARANALARGFSGIRPLVVNRFIDFLNKGVYPEIPTEGSVGASGDLVPLAHLARSLIGLGDVSYDGAKVKAESLLKTMKLEPIELLAKEGLALVNGTSVMTGVAALATYDAANMLSLSEAMTAFYVEVMFGESEPFCHRVAMARGHRGQALVADRIADILRSSSQYKIEIDEHHWGCHQKPIAEGVDIQDPYSLRCVPQILGAIQDALWHIQAVVTRELNSTTDNPLIFPEDKMVIHCGNFYGQHVSMVMDYLKISMAKLALLVERQTERLMNEKYNLGLSPMLSQGKLGLNSGLMGCQILSTSLAAEIRMLSNPASVQTIPTNANNQDVVSMGCIASKNASKMLTLVWKVLAVQALSLVQACDLRGESLKAGEKFRMFYQRVRELSPELTKDRPLYKDIEKVINLLKDDSFISSLTTERPLSSDL